MATSGTIATTAFNTAKVLEHAFRRCRIKTAAQTPEMVAAATENLYLLLLSLSNRGLNLWCVDTTYIGFTAGQGAYTTAAGTIDVLNAIYSQPTRVTGADGTTGTSITTALGASTTVLRVGVKLTAVTASDTLVISSSADGVTYTPCSTITKTDWNVGEWYWVSLDPTVTATYFKAAFTNTASFSEFYLAGGINDLPLSQWNIDTWSAIPNKQVQGKPSTCYYYEKLLTPRITLWPVPNNSYDHLTIFRHRQIQDIGTLTQSIEIPQRWFEGITWQLAGRIAFEADGVDPALIGQVQAMADKYLLQAEGDETDGAPIYLQPSISVYTR